MADSDGALGNLKKLYTVFPPRVCAKDEYEKMQKNMVRNFSGTLQKCN
jgi:hypothetical protein